MLSKKLTVVNPSGLHLRPAGVLSQAAMKFKCDVIIECGEKRIVAKSVLNVMAAGIKCGTEINLICDGGRGGSYGGSLRSDRERTRRELIEYA